MKKAVLLLSGGLDSATCLYLAKSNGYSIYAISFDYGQRHKKEIDSARIIANKAGVIEHKVIKINLESLGGSALTDNKILLPAYNPINKNIPITYVPGRNMIFLSIAASYAEIIGADNIFIGISQVDYSGYIDCRQSFLDAMQNVINNGLVHTVEKKKKMTLHAPLINMNKSEEIKLGMSLGTDYSYTWSCYEGNDDACGKCDSCGLRLKAFADAGYDDPLTYRK